MAESDLGRQIAAAVQSSLAPVAAYLALVTQNNPRASADAMLGRPDVSAVITEALDEAHDNAAAAVEQAWLATGAPEGPEYRHLVDDVARLFAALAHLRGLVRHAHASVPQREFVPGVTVPGENPSTQAAAERAGAVRDAIMSWARQASLRARMTVSTAEGLARTAVVLKDAQDLGEAARKRWRAHTGSASCCFWCRRLDGVTIGLRESFAPYLGGPAAMPQRTARRVATPAGARRYGLPHGSPIVLTHPPRPYHGDLQGPLLHPFCRCWLEVVRGHAPRAEPEEPGQAAAFLAAADVRAMPEDSYRAQLAFLRAAAGELGQVLNRLAEG